MTRGEKKENQIKRSKTIKSINTKAEEKLNAIKRTSTMKQPGHADMFPELFGAEIHTAKKEPEIMTELKEKAESIPVLVPAEQKTEQKTEQESVQKTGQTSQQKTEKKSENT